MVQKFQKRLDPLCQGFLSKFFKKRSKHPLEPAPAQTNITTVL
jgi:hypothetical protein